MGAPMHNAGPTGGSALRYWANLATLAIMASLLCGCTTINLVTTDDVTARRFDERAYLGAVRIRLPQITGKQLAAVDVETLGLGWTGGPVLGWQSGRWVYADPTQCQMLVIIRSPAQAENAKDILQALEGEKLCFVDTIAR